MEERGQGPVSAPPPIDCKQPSTILSVRPAATNSLHFALVHTDLIVAPLATVWVSSWHDGN